MGFAGAQFIQKFGYYSAIVRLKLQYNVFQNLYVTALGDLGTDEQKFEKVFQPASLMCGYGITAGYNSIIGPVELTLMGGNLNPNPMVFVNIGYNF